MLFLKPSGHPYCLPLSAIINKRKRNANQYNFKLRSGRRCLLACKEIEAGGAGADQFLEAVPGGAGDETGIDRGEPLWQNC